MRKLFLLVAVMALSNGVCAADPDVQDGESLGLLLGATITPRTLTSVIVTQCIKRLPEIQNAGEEALGIWDKNNSKYEAQARAIAEKISRKLELKIGKNQTDDLVVQTTSNIRDSASGAAGEFMAKMVDIVPREKQKQTCLNMFAAIKAGKIDIPTNQPSAYKIMLEAR